ncbi:MAG: sodium:alanine symporter family protein [Bacillota bacterium]|nr:sodium:alanine symporter family protein [Bacillota bacterium]
MHEFLLLLEKFNDKLNDIVWGIPVLLFILLIGLMFTVRLGFFQFTKYKVWMKATFGSFLKKKGGSTSSGISTFQAMSTALAGAIGTGNIVGVATAITLGGPGAIFWMWIAAFLGMMTSFAENILGVLYRQKNKKGQWVGGPMYYIEKGLHQKWLAVIFAVACMIAALGIGNMTQSNSIAAALNMSFNVPPITTAIIVAIVCSAVIFGGIKRIAKVTEMIVPFMSAFYILGCLIVLAVNFHGVPSAFINIITGAFQFKTAAAGAGGYTISLAVKYGISRGVFSNEAGLGSSPIIHAATDDYNPIRAGMWGIFQVFIDTIVVCTLTAFCILSTNECTEGLDGVELSAVAFNGVFHEFGGLFITVSVLLFAFATLISWSYFGEKSLEYLSGDKLLPFYKAFYVLCAALGCVMNLRLVWEISDTFNGIMAIPNLIALLFLSKQVIKEVKSKSKKFTKI